MISDTNVFSSPTVASLQRLGRISPSRSRLRCDQSDCSNSETTTNSIARSHYAKTSRRPSRRIQTQEDTELFDHLSVSTSVKLSRRQRDDDEPEPGSQIIDVVEGALNLLRSLSMTSAINGDTSNMDGYIPGLPSSLRAIHQLDLRNNDNSFHVLASMLVDFFQQRAYNNKITLLPDDRRTIERMLPEATRIPFIEAVQYRLASTPVSPQTPLHLLTLHCKELGFNLLGDVNPLLAACQMRNVPLNFAVLKVVQTDDNGESRSDVERIDEPRGIDTQAQVEREDILVSDESSNEEAIIENCDDTAMMVVALALTTMSSFSKDEVTSPLDESTSSASDDAAFSVDSQAMTDLLLTINRTSRPENIEQRQIWFEIREAATLIQQSENKETKKFWLRHVYDLQARLDEMQGKKSSTAPMSRSSRGKKVNVTVEKTVRRALSKLLNRGQSKSPVTLSHNKKMFASIRDPPALASDYDMRMVDVIAPGDLPGTYQFEAKIDGQRFLATVPPGGVRKGEIFSCYMNELGTIAIDIPEGYWQDDMSQVCRYGLCHCMVINTMFCPLITLSQVQFRTRLDYLGRPRYGSLILSNRTIMLSIIAFWTVTNILLVGECISKWNEDGLELSKVAISAFVLINVSMLSFSIFVTKSTRGSIREKYMIRDQKYCFYWEDICYSTFCLPCTVCHMARHTAQYDEYEAVCCSKTGLPDGVRVRETIVTNNRSKATSSDSYFL